MRRSAIVRPCSASSPGAACASPAPRAASLAGGGACAARRPLMASAGADPPTGRGRGLARRSAILTPQRKPTPAVRKRGGLRYMYCASLSCAPKTLYNMESDPFFGAGMPSVAEPVKTCKLAKLCYIAFQSASSGCAIFQMSRLGLVCSVLSPPKERKGSQVQLTRSWGSPHSRRR